MKYPRTPHLPWSEGVSKDDRIIKSLETLTSSEVIITEKMDGSNVCLTRDHIFSRSHSGPPKHPSFDWLKQIHTCTKSLIPEGWEMFGEWLFAKHSIAYCDLESYLQIFAIRNNNTWLSYDDVVKFTDENNFTRVPLIYQGHLREKDLKMYCEGGEMKEGIVVRVARSFTNDEFSSCVAKWVRPFHIQSDEHWMHQAITMNGLK